MVIKSDWKRKDLEKIRRKILRETPKGWEPRRPVVALKNAKAGEYVPIAWHIIPKQSGDGAGPDLNQSTNHQKHRGMLHEQDCSQAD